MTLFELLFATLALLNGVGLGMYAFSIGGLGLGIVGFLAGTAAFVLVGEGLEALSSAIRKRRRAAEVLCSVCKKESDYDWVESDVDHDLIAECQCGERFVLKKGHWRMTLLTLLAGVACALLSGTGLSMYAFSIGGLGLGIVGFHAGIAAFVLVVEGWGALSFAIHKRKRLKEVRCSVFEDESDDKWVGGDADHDPIAECQCGERFVWKKGHWVKLVPQVEDEGGTQR